MRSTESITIEVIDEFGDVYDLDLEYDDGELDGSLDDGYHENLYFERD